jgi:hypothetical protein
VWPAEVQVIPFKTTYGVSETIAPASDLMVYYRDTTTGTMKPAAKGTAAGTTYTLNYYPSGSGSMTDPSIGTGFTSADEAANPVSVLVKMNGYPGGGTEAQAPYNVWVGSSTPNVSPVFLAFPLRSAYMVNETINPGSDLAVYKSGPAGAMALLTYGTDYTLSAVNGVATINPASTPFTPAGTWTITVTDAVDTTVSTTYTVNVTAAEVTTLRVMYINGSQGPGMKLNVQGAYALDGPPQGRMIHSVIPLKPDGTPFMNGVVEVSYLVGRMDNEPVTLNINASGTLGLRPALVDGPYSGLVPIGTAEELRLIGVEGSYVLTADIDLLGFSSYAPHTWRGSLL